MAEILGHSQTKERATGNPNLSLHRRATSRLYPAGQADEARAQWAKALAMAEAQHDQTTIDLIRKHLPAAP